MLVVRTEIGRIARLQYYTISFHIYVKYLFAANSSYLELVKPELQPEGWNGRRGSEVQTRVRACWTDEIIWLVFTFLPLNWRR